MAQFGRPSDLVRKIKQIGDLDVAPSSGREREEVIDKVEKVELGEVEDRSRRVRIRPQQQLTMLDEQLHREDRVLQRRRQRAAPNLAHTAAWRRVGIQQRMSSLEAPVPVRVGILGVLAGIDFFVFANAVAVSEDVPQELTEPQYLLGGVFGLVVFALGYLLARLVKRAIYAFAQRRLLEEVSSDERELPDDIRRDLVLARPQWLVMAIVGGLFVLSVALAFQIRWESMGPTDSPYVVVLLSLIPVVAAAVELYMYDPTDVEEPQPSRAHRRLEVRRSQLEEQLAGIETEREEGRQRVRERVDLARAMWRVERADLGFDAPGEAASARDGDSGDSGNGAAVS